MKRWLTVSFALSTFVGILVVGIFSFYQIKFGSLDAPSAPVAAQPRSVDSGSNSNVSFSDVETFFKEKGVTLSIAPTIPLSWAEWNTYDSTNNSEVRTAASELKTEWTKYSNQIIKTSGLKNIYLVKKLSVTGQYRSAMPDPEVTQALYFDVSEKYMQSEEGDYMRRTFHHEFRHLIEYNLSGSYSPNDAAWTSCNAATAVYGDGGASMYADPEFAHKAHPSFGFIDGYATSATEEDKAEIFAYYMTDATYVQELATQDSGIACKLDQTEKLLQNM